MTENTNFRPPFHERVQAQMNDQLARRVGQLVLAEMELSIRLGEVVADLENLSQMSTAEVQALKAEIETLKNEAVLDNFGDDALEEALHIRRVARQQANGTTSEAEVDRIIADTLRTSSFDPPAVNASFPDAPTSLTGGQ